jgi:hypothetical protein
MFGRDGLAVVGVGQQRVLREKVLQRQISRPAVIVSVAHDELRGRLHTGPAEQLAGRDALPQIAQSGPARHTVEVGKDPDSWERSKLRKFEGKISFDQSEDPQGPVTEVHRRRAKSI